MPRWVDASAVAKHLSFYRKNGEPNVDLVWEKARKRELPAARIPGSRMYRFDLEAIDQILSASLAGGAQASNVCSLKIRQEKKIANDHSKTTTQRSDLWD